jgi:hypothetical protein
MIIRGVFPNTEKLVIGHLARWLTAHGMTYDVWSELPEGWEDDDQLHPLPLVLVERVPGGGRVGDRDAEYESSSYIDVSVMTRTRPELWPIVQQIEVAMISFRASVGLIDTVNNPQSFGEVKYKNPRIRRAVASYEISARAQ